MTRDGTAKPVSRDQILVREGGQGKTSSFSVQLTTSRIGNHIRLIHTLLNALTMITITSLYWDLSSMESWEKNTVLEYFSSRRYLKKDRGDDGIELLGHFLSFILVLYIFCYNVSVGNCFSGVFTMLSRVASTVVHTVFFSY